MKGVIKKCGLLLVFSIMLGLSFVGFSDVSALKYSYSRFPISEFSYFGNDINQMNYQTGTPAFSLTLDTTGIPASAFENFPLPEGKQTQRQWLSQSGGGYCNTFNDKQAPLWYSNYSSQYNSLHIVSNSGPGYFQGYKRLDYPLASDFNNPLNTFTQNVLDCVNSRTWDYDAIVGGKINVSTGDFSDYVNIPQLFNFDATNETIGLKDIRVLLNIYPEALKSVPSGTPLEWNFELFSTEQLTDVYANPSAKLRLGYSPYDPDSYTGSYSSMTSPVSSEVTCSVDPNHEFLILEDNSLEVNIYAYGYKVTCSYTAPTDMAYINAQLILSNPNDSSPLFKFSDRLFFGSSYLVTNNDDTWSGLDISFPLTGDDITKAPGYAEIYCDNAAGCDQNSTCNPGDFLCNLQNLFNFDFINPFSPIFSLFTGSSSCVQIPTIAGMIHSEETTVCPWFPANVREIVTPVLGLSSMMLIFGFAVRWLGSSSGNLFEDSSNETLAPPGWSGSWGRRKK